MVVVVLVVVVTLIVVIAVVDVVITVGPRNLNIKYGQNQVSKRRYIVLVFVVFLFIVVDVVAKLSSS